jgi:hypothetical protein
MLQRAVKVIGDKGATEAGGFPVRREHQMVDEQLAATCKKFGKSFFAAGRIEGVILLDFNPGQGAAFGGEGIAVAGVLFLVGQQLLAGSEPFFLGNNFVLRLSCGGAHRVFSLVQNSLSRHRADLGQ